MANIAQIPYPAATGAEIDITSTTAVNESAGGISGRLNVRQTPIRQFHLTIGPTETPAVKSIFYTVRRRWPVAVRDWSDYAYTGEILAISEVTTDTTYAPLRRLILPSTGTRYLHQRILIPDETFVPTTIRLDGEEIAYGTGGWNFEDFGIIAIPNSLFTSGSEVISASGQYLVAACFMADQLTVKIEHDGFVTLPDVQLREILEPELIDLMSQTDDSV